MIDDSPRICVGARIIGRPSPQVGEALGPEQELAHYKKKSPPLANEDEGVGGGTPVLVRASPEKWHFPYFNDEMGETIGAAMAQADAMLIGRVTYEEWAAYWPSQNPDDNQVAGFMNNTPKYVVSTTLQGPLGWNNSTLIKENVAQEITDLKKQEGKDISISGSGALVRSLLREDVLDELRLIVHPVVVGRGKRLFEEGGDQKSLKLVDSKTFGTGVVYLTYWTSGE